MPRELVGQEVSVGVPGSEEVLGAEILGTLEEIRDDGVVLSHIGELESGITMFVPRDAIRRIRPRPTWEDMAPSVSQLVEEPYPGVTRSPEPSPERIRPSAHALDRVVPIGQRRTVGEATVALISLELFGEGVGVLRYRISHDGSMFYGIPEPELIVRDGSGRELPWAPQGSSSSESEADGEVEVHDLPEAGELEVEVTRLVSLGFDEEAREEIEEDSYDGPWTFRFSI